MMKKMMIIAVLAALSLGGSAHAMLDMDLLYNTYVDSDNADTSFAGLDVLRLQNGKTDLFSYPQQNHSIQHIFLQFDLSVIPQMAELTSAQFGIYLNGNTETPKPNLQLWDINNNGWNNALTWTDSLGILGNEVAIDIVQPTDSVGRYYFWNLIGAWDYTAALQNGAVSFMLTIESENVHSYSYASFNSEQNEAFQPYLKLA